MICMCLVCCGWYSLCGMKAKECLEMFHLKMGSLGRPWQVSKGSKASSPLQCQCQSLVQNVVGDTVSIGNKFLTSGTTEGEVWTQHFGCLQQKTSLPCHWLH
ncbi:hypothetical protein HELRODRAFT_164530 [Helobdella robusta]|uniref:Uncharacterized protein n=1 Tax=Helobdella robusta TaxID=6412 RepID=T1EVJ3_HELRO|nr:hypothetical protein HELRODRAFT_164530 [Helobdella robusta]ESN94651.1 hypothetical protein HELRODRAFT_164530 [Helobdella robusta]